MYPTELYPGPTIPSQAVGWDAKINFHNDNFNIIFHYADDNLLTAVNIKFKYADNNINFHYSDVNINFHYADVSINFHHHHLSSIIHHHNIISPYADIDIIFHYAVQPFPISISLQGRFWPSLSLWSVFALDLSHGY